MSTAQLFVDAIHTANAVAHALLWWALLLAALCVFVIPTVIGGAAWAVDTARSRLDRSESAETAVPVPESPRTAKRPSVPSWAHTEPYTYDEAA